LLSACLVVGIITKSGSFTTAVAHGLCGLDIVFDYICTPSLRRAANQTAAKTFGCFS